MVQGMRSNNRRVVITGIGPVTPVGVGINEFWSSVANGWSGTHGLTYLPNGFPVRSLRSQVVATVREDRLPSGYGGSEVGRHSRLAQLAVQLALSDASLGRPLPERTALVFGSAVGGTAAMESSFLEMEKGERGIRACSFGIGKQISFHSVAHELAISMRCSGPVLTISTGCTAGLDAINMAFSYVRSGQCEVVVAASAEAPITPIVFAAFDVIGALSTRNHDPEHASRPFDKERDGFVLAEGAAALVIEDYSHARRRGAHIYAELLGSASVSNAYHMTDLPSDGFSLAHCIQLALRDADLNVQDVDHVNAHGSSTQQNDLCETNAVKSAFGARARSITVNSLKAVVGHALGASNAIEVAACALSLDRQYIFPTANLCEPGEGCDLDYVPQTGRCASLKVLAKLSSGFSGIHSTLVMGATPQEVA